MAGFVCGLIGAVLGLIPLLFVFALILGVLGLVFGVIGWRAARHGAPRKGLAVAGTILGVITIVLGVIGTAIVNDAFDDLGGGENTTFRRMLLERNVDRIAANYAYAKGNLPQRLIEEEWAEVMP